MKKVVFLAAALLGAVCVEIYSSQQELKFDEGVPTYPTLTRGGPTGGGGTPESVHCRFKDGGEGECIISPISDCMAIPDDYCEGVVVTPGVPE